LWEFGLGPGAIVFESYRGSDTTHALPLPIPYVIYNGDFFKVDRDGVRGTLFDQKWLEINLSFNVTTPVRNDRVRSGMPDLHSTVEVGPSFDIHLYRSKDARTKLDLRMPLRAAATVELTPHVVGWTFSPNLNLDIKDPLGFDGWRVGLLSGPLFADRRYHDYFYSVAPQYATPTRPPFQGEGGYAGTQFLAALTRRYPKFWMGAYGRYDTLAGAVFINSPLVQRQSYWTAGIGFAWILHTSSQLVDVPD
jgi:outer membrane scaffolding protein for murein synthesis (MipA/OmpV family)